MKKIFLLAMCQFGWLAFAGISEITAYRSMDFSNSLLWGKVPQWGLDDETGKIGTQGSYYWWYYGDSGNGSIITNYASYVEAYDRFSEDIDDFTNPQPPYMKKGGDNQGYLEFKTTSPLARLFETWTDKKRVEIPANNDLFVDALVQFEPRTVSSTEVPTVDVEECARFMCWMSAESNLVVTAGKFAADGSLYRVNYVVTNKVSAGVWYRLTARAIRNAATKAEVSEVMFALHLDGVPVACAVEDYCIGDVQSAMDAKFVGNRFYNECSLFPPMRKFTEVNPGFYGIAMQGAGKFDEFAVVNDGDPFERLGVETAELIIAADPTFVTNLAYIITRAGVTDTNNAGAVSSVTVSIRPSDVVEVVALPAEGVSLADDLALFGNTAVVKTPVSGYKLNISDDVFGSGNPLTARVNAYNCNFVVGGKTYQSLLDALEAANDSAETLSLERDVTLDSDPEAENGQMRILPYYGIVFDLKGHWLTGQHFQHEAAIYDQGQLTIVNSGIGGGIRSDGEVIEVAANDDAINVNHKYASVTLGDEVISNSFDVIGRVRNTKGALSIKGGRYLTPFDLLPVDDFYLRDYLADANRFDVIGPEQTGTSEFWYSVVYNGKFLVNFETTKGFVPEPSVITVASNSLISPPAVAQVGYTLTNWYVKGESPKRNWNFAEDRVVGDMTLVGNTILDVYDITYDITVPYSAPTTYTVESRKRMIPDTEVTRQHFRFDGWVDTNTNRRVDSVGEGAVFVGTEVTVTGKLDLAAQWVGEQMRWANVEAGLCESNGTYKGSWSFTIPAAEGLAAGAKVRVNEINFCIVNPLLYPKTAEYLALTNALGMVLGVSELRPIPEIGEDGHYLVGTNVLANGRARVGYRFADEMVVKVGETNAVFFSTVTGAPATDGGFLRLVHLPQGGDAVFGNCETNSASAAIERYGEFCPAYEVLATPMD